MGRDKAFIDYHGFPQVEWMKKLLAPYCHDCVMVFKSTPETTDHFFLTDDPAYGDIGPMAGVLTAHRQFPDNPLLVVGCDYPLLQSTDIEQLIMGRSSEFPAVAFTNTTDNRPEPLLCIYEVSGLQKIYAFFEKGDHSLRSCLERLSAKTLAPADPIHISSFDTPEQAGMLLKKSSLGQ
jgi:molybdopterin-guanine dinucleotide biosynthesis protein A